MSDEQGALAQAAAMQAALAAMPSWNGIVFRGASLSAVQLDAYRAAASQLATLVEPGFVSATPDPAIRFEGNAVIAVWTESARDITALSTASEWQEVMLPARSPLAVLAVDAMDGTNVAVLLADVSGEPSLAPDAVLAALRRAVGARSAAAASDTQPPASWRERLSGAVGIDESGRRFADARPPA
ncbi:MAG: hypothetical protein JOZ75_02490 [Candidatus Dormibacteraeota bacterium]|nr:hypothetical protein [Candidatus Dormibacteraeota bacterium]